MEALEPFIKLLDTWNVGELLTKALEFGATCSNGGFGGGGGGRLGVLLTSHGNDVNKGTTVRGAETSALLMGNQNCKGRFDRQL